MHPLQVLINGMAADHRRQRAQTQMTLGGVIATLEVLPHERAIVGLGTLDSYRGYYADLAFEPNEEPRTVAGLLAECRGAMGKVFCGYKGGEFVMGERTPLWVAAWGSTGERLMGLDLDADPIRPTTAPDED